MHNEVLRVADTARQLVSALENLRYYCGYEYEMIFVDGGSNDGSVETLLNVADIELIRNLRIIPHRETIGKGQAIREGVLASSGDTVIIIDCDLAYGTDIFRTAVERIGTEADVVIGSRRLLHDSFVGYTLPRRIISSLYQTFLRVFGGFGYSDAQCAFKVFSGKAAHKIFSIARTNGYAYDYEAVMLADKMGCRIMEIPVPVMGISGADFKMIKHGFTMIHDVLKIKKRLKKIRFVNRRNSAQH